VLFICSPLCGPRQTKPTSPSPNQSTNDNLNKPQQRPEIESAARLRLQQAELTWSMELQRLEGRMADALEARSKLEQQAAALTKDLEASTRDASTFRAQAEELRTANAALDARSEELGRTVAALQSVVNEMGVAATRMEREAVAEVESKVRGWLTQIWAGVQRGTYCLVLTRCSYCRATCPQML